jgi:hypothetical protein
MKKLLVLALLVVGMTTFAQEVKPQEGKPGKERFTPEQRNQLVLKKMILELDLNTAQQKEMATIIAEQTAKHEALKKQREESKASGKKLSTDEKFAKVNKMLDEKIAMKTRVKTILNADQLVKWEKMQEKNEKKMRGKMKGKMHKKDFQKE